MALNATLAPPSTPARSIEVLQIEPGDTPGVLARLDVRIGGMIVRSVTVRQSRGGGVHINYPSRKIAGVWVSLVTITSPGLRECVEAAIKAAALEVVR